MNVVIITKKGDSVDIDTQIIPRKGDMIDLSAVTYTLKQADEDDSPFYIVDYVSYTVAETNSTKGFHGNVFGDALVYVHSESEEA